MKCEKILNDTWQYLEDNYKGSEITMQLWINTIEKMCDNDYCLKQCIKMLWDQWEWFDLEEKDYYRNYIKNDYGVKVV